LQATSIFINGSFKLFVYDGIDAVVVRVALPLLLLLLAETGIFSARISASMASKSSMLSSPAVSNFVASCRWQLLLFLGILSGASVLNKRVAQCSKMATRQGTSSGKVIWL
jgi:hypothetical protein